MAEGLSLFILSLPKDFSHLPYFPYFYYLPYLLSFSYNIPMSAKLLIVVGLFILLPFVSAAPVHAQTKSWSGGCVYKDAQGDDIATFQGVECIVSNFLNVAITLIGVAILVMIVFGAYQILASGGDPKAVEGGKATITHAVLGLIIAISAWFIISFIAKFTGSEQITKFNTQVTTQ
jgi:hypothetical protein